MSRSEKLIIVATLALGVALRLVKLGSMQPGFFRDEAALGYNAYSILATGKDEYGMALPMVFRSFEVFFLPLYVYLSTPLVFLLGLSEFSTRLLSALSGISIIVIALFIARELWGEKEGLVSTALVAVAPWAIFYSRGAFEGHLALAFFAGGFLFFIRYLKKWKLSQFLVSLLLFIFSMYSYQSSRVVVPLFLLINLPFYYRDLYKKKRKLVLPLIVGIVILIPLIRLTFTPAGMYRAAGVSIFAKNERSPGWIDGENPGILINNGYFLRGKQLASLYLSYYSPRNLFYVGDDNPQRTSENYSVFYLFMMPLTVLGLYRLIKEGKVFGKVLLVWIVLAPIPAALTGDPFHTYRSLLLFLPLNLLAGYGAVYLAKMIKYKKVYWGVLSGLILISVTYFVYDYAVIAPATKARDWDYGYKEMTKYLNGSGENQKVVVDDPWTQGYIHFLFFNKVEPAIYHQEVVNIKDPIEYYYSDPAGYRPGKFGNYEFKDVDWSTVRGDTGTVFVFTPEELPESEFKGDPHVKLLKEIYYPDKTIAYRIVEII